MASIHDSHSFILPEQFFESVSRGEFTSAQSISYSATDNEPTNPVIKTGVLLRINSGDTSHKPLILLQFIRPLVWRIRFDPGNTKPEQYHDYNSRTIISDTLTNLVKILDKIEKIFWRTKFIEGSPSDLFYVLQSIVYPTEEDKINDTNRTVVTELNIYKNPCKIQAVRLVEESGVSDPPQALSTSKRKVIWETKESGLSWKKGLNTKPVYDTMLTAKKPGHARYLGFGEQGGRGLLKKSTLMNFFNFDNMTYSSVYNEGPLDEREPLYHSEPFWLEVNGLPNYKSQVATFVDDYSQILCDFSKNHGGDIKVGTRFGTMQYYVFAGNNVADIIRLYSSIIGRARLKPRYILGHHQSCYGYDTRKKVLTVARNYTKRDIPLDGMHIDVDLQRGLRTFTIDEKGKFPKSQEMFTELRNLGIKCCTNITPVINSTPDPDYTTLNTGLRDNHFIMDKRYDDGDGVVPYNEVEYICYEKGIKLLIDPVNEMGQFPGAQYDFAKNYNQGVPYRGGVGYGGTLGAPGYYPDLNKQATRKWWGEQYEHLFKQGLEFIWQDMTGPCIAKEYGDMKGLPFRLMISSDRWSTEEDELKPVLEIWALYAYNLHKATYEGLNSLEVRRGKRNFIIGRGGFSGLHKWAGLWTGDNASTWDHFRISVSQVLALGLSGVEISGADVGGFMPASGFENIGPRYAEPELLTRWYCAYSLLPWFRNHYHGKRDMKLFQEPYAFTDYYNANPSVVPEKDRFLWLSVEPICRYYVKLRYTLLQLLYDTMFEHQFHGLPIARALIITDTEDSSLLADNDWVLENEYIVGNDLLVAPVMHKQEHEGGHRKIYLPQPDYWYRLNLRIKKGHIGDPLEKRIEGGSKFDVDAHIASEAAFLPSITPMFVREGAIIPQIEVRQHTTPVDGDVNPIHLHVYPGSTKKTSTYRMFLDDGVSRDSAPEKEVPGGGGDPRADLDADPEAKSKYREVKFEQKREVLNGKDTRTLTISTPHNGYDPKSIIGPNYHIVFWHDQNVNVTADFPKVEVTGATGAGQPHNDITRKASVVTIPVDATGAFIKVTY